MEVEIAIERTSKSKLTVTANGNVRIKFAKDLDRKGCDIVQARLMKVAEKVIDTNVFNVLGNATRARSAVIR